MANKLKEVNQFISKDLWLITLSSLPKYKATAYRILRILIITWREYSKDKCAEKASALTYFSILSVVPVIAMAFGIATIFGLKDYLITEMNNYFGAQREVLEYAQGFADNMLSNSSGGIISGISAVFLIYAVAKLLNRIEAAFNDIWNTPKGRSIKRKLTDYMSVILLGPLVLILSSSTAVFLTTSIETLTENIGLLEFIRPLILFLLQLVPYTLIWLLLFLVYLVFPNTNIKLVPALIAGIVAGTIYQFIQFGWINGQVYLSSYNAIYSTFAALPLFLIWLQLSWMVVLLGGELAYAIQNANTWSYDHDDLVLSHKAKRKITLLVLRKIVHDFRSTNNYVDFESMCTDLHVPRKFLGDAVFELMAAGLIVKLAVDGSDSECYQPGIDTSQLDIFMAYDRLESVGMDSLINLDRNEGVQEITDVMTEMEGVIKSSSANKKISDL